MPSPCLISTEDPKMGAKNPALKIIQQQAWLLSLSTRRENQQLQQLLSEILIQLPITTVAMEMGSSACQSGMTLRPGLDSPYPQTKEAAGA